MAFFGSDGLDNQVKQMKSQLAGKDMQLATYMEELTKKNEILEEYKRAKEDAVYKCEQEADTFIRADKLLKSTTTELQSTRLQLSNLEQAYQTSQSRHTQDEKELKRLQYEVDSLKSRSSSNSGGSSAGDSRLKQAHKSLEEKVKELEGNLRRSEGEKESLRVDLSMAMSGGSGRGGMTSGFSGSAGGTAGDTRSKIIELEGQVEGLRRDNVRLMAEVRNAQSSSSSTPAQSRSRDPFASSTTASPSPRRNRAQSVHHQDSSSSSRIIQLENEIETLKSQLSSSSSSNNQSSSNESLDSLKKQLEQARKSELQSTNQKIASERAFAREIEGLKEKLEDVMEELEDRRRFADSLEANGSSGGGNVSGKEELEKLKKEISRERQVLESKIRELEEDLRKRAGEVEKLEEIVQRLRNVMVEKNEEIETARLAAVASSKRSRSTTVVQPEESSTGNSSSKEIQALQREVQDLQSRLAEEVASKLSSTSTTPDSLDGSSSSALAESQVKIRGLERDLARKEREMISISAELQENDRLIAEKDEEIVKLQQKASKVIPIPLSRRASISEDNSAGGSGSNEADTARIQQLEEECEQLRQKEVVLQKQIYDREQRIAGLDKELEESYLQLEVVKEELRKERSDFSIFKGEQEAFVTQRESFEADLSTTQASLAARQREVDHLGSQLVLVRSEQEKLTKLQADTVTAKLELQGRIETLNSRLAELSPLQERIIALTQDLANRSYVDSAVQDILKQKEELESALVQCKKELKDMDTMEFGARKQRDSLQEEVDVLKVSLTNAEEKAKRKSADVEEKIASLDEAISDLRIALAQSEQEKIQLNEQLSEAENAVANRTTESESRQRDDLVSQLRETIKSAETDVKLANHAQDDALAQLEQVKGDLVDAQKMLTKSEVVVKELQITLGGQEASCSSLERQLEQATVDLESQKKAFATELQQNKQSSSTRISTLEKEIQAASVDKGELKRLLAFAEMEHQSTVQAQSEHNTEVQATRSKLASLTDELASTTQALELAKSAEAALTSANQERERLRDELAATQCSLSDSEGLQQKLATELKAAQLQVQDKTEQITKVTLEKEALAQSIDIADKPVDESVALLQAEKSELLAKIQRREKQILKQQQEESRLRINLELTSDSIKEQEETINELTAQVTALQKANTSLEATIAQETDKLTVANSELLRSQSLWNGAKQEQVEFSTSTQTLVLELAKLVRSRQAINSELTKAKVKVEQLHDEQNTLTNNFASLRFDYEQVQTERDSALVSVTSLRELHKNELASAQSSLEDTLHKLEQSETSHSDLKSSVATMDKALAEATSQGWHLKGRLDKVENELSAVKEEKEQVIKELGLVNEKLAKTVQQASEVDQTSSSLSSQLEGLRSALDSSQQRLADATKSLELGRIQQAESESAFAEQLAEAQQEIDDKVYTCVKAETALAELRAEVAAQVGAGTTAAQAAVEKAEDDVRRLKEQLEAEVTKTQAAEATTSQLMAAQSELSTQVETSNTKAIQLEGQVEDLSARLTQTEDARQVLMEEISSAQRLVEERETVVKFAVSASEQLENDLMVCRRELQSVELERNNMASAIGELDDLRRQLKSAVEDRDEAVRSTTSLQATEARLKAEIATIRSTPVAAGNTAELEAKVVDLEDTIKRIEQESAATNELSDTLNEQIQQLDKEVSKMRKKAERAEMKMKQAEARAVSAENSLATATTRTSALEENLRAVMERATAVETRMKDLGIPATPGRAKVAAPAPVVEPAAATEPGSGILAGLRRKASILSPTKDRRAASSPWSGSAVDMAPEVATSRNVSDSTPVIGRKRGREGASSPTRPNLVDVIVRPASYDQPLAMAPPPPPPSFASPAPRPITSRPPTFTPSRSGAKPRTFGENQNLPPVTNSGFTTKSDGMKSDKPQVHDTEQRVPLGHKRSGEALRPAPPVTSVGSLQARLAGLRQQRGA